MKEKHVLASTIKDRKAYDSVFAHVDREDLSEQGWIIWKAVQEYYDRDLDAADIDATILTDMVSRGISAKKHKQMFNRLIESLHGLDVSPPNVVHDLLQTKLDSAGQLLAAELLSGTKPNGLLHKYQQLIDATTLSTLAEESETRRGFSVMELVKEKFASDNLVQISPKSLNSRLDGGLKAGHHVILFARPEMGKTMMTIEMISGFLSQGLRVLYIGNEDPIDDVNMRIISRLSEMTKAEILKEPEDADTKAREKGYEYLSMASLAPGTPREIESLIVSEEPDILILDQLRNLNMGQDNYTLKLEEAATKAREWAKKHKLVVVSVTQAGDSASGKAVLDIGDVDYSNTGIPAQADVMIGLGATDKNQMRGEIVVSLPKNKVSGSHEWFTLLSHPHYSKLESID